MFDWLPELPQEVHKKFLPPDPVKKQVDNQMGGFNQPVCQRQRTLSSHVVLESTVATPAAEVQPPPAQSESFFNILSKEYIKGRSYALQLWSTRPPTLVGFLLYGSIACLLVAVAAAILAVLSGVALCVCFCVGVILLFVGLLASAGLLVALAGSSLACFFIGGFGFLLGSGAVGLYTACYSYSHARSAVGHLYVATNRAPANGIHTPSPAAHSPRRSVHNLVSAFVDECTTLYPRVPPNVYVPKPGRTPSCAAIPTN